jgi:hypothetical protein
MNWRLHEKKFVASFKIIFLNLTVGTEEDQESLLSLQPVSEKRF